MNKKIPASVLDKLIDNAIISEAEQKNIELGHALKSITPEQLRSIFYKEEIFADSVTFSDENHYSDIFHTSKDETACIHTQFNNPLPMGNSPVKDDLIDISDDIAVEGSVESDQSYKRKEIPFRRLVRERIIWAASIAALIIISIPIIYHISKTSKNAGEISGKCEMLYAYNVDEIPDLSVGVKGDYWENVPDIISLSKSQLEEAMPEIIELFSNSDMLQEIDINGRILAMAYLRLDKPSDAKEILTIMVSRLSSEPEDYKETIDWCKKIISQLQ